jgi:ABC-type antimicrobial peptide transport system permease subunit
VRLSLGASPGRLMQLLMTEAVLLGVLGSAAALLIADLGVQSLRALLPPPVLARTDGL